MAVLTGFELYTIGGLSVVGATVEVWNAAAGTPAGSPIASTTTDSNGEWTFTGLTDTPKDVKVTFTGGVVRWYKGLTSAHLAQLLVGGAVVIAGGTIDAASAAAVALTVAPTLRATADNDVLTALRLNATYNDNGHSGVQHAGFSIGSVANNIGGGMNVNTGLQIQFGAGSGNKILDLLNGAGTEYFYVRSDGAAAFFGPYISLSGAPAGAGAIRLPTSVNIDWRNAGNTNDHAVGFNSSDEFVIAPNLTATFVMDTTGRIRLSSGSPNAAYKLHILGLGASSATWGFRSENNVGGLIFGVRDDGLVAFGTVVGTAGASAGYVTILDAGGNQRKIQVFAP
jgi:hypothetical protein